MKLGKAEVDLLYVCASLFYKNGDLAGIDFRKEGSARLLAQKVADFLEDYRGAVTIFRED